MHSLSMYDHEPHDWMLVTAQLCPTEFFENLDRNFDAHIWLIICAQHDPESCKSDRKLSSIIHTLSLPRSHYSSRCCECMADPKVARIVDQNQIDRNSIWTYAMQGCSSLHTRARHAQKFSTLGQAVYVVSPKRSSSGRGRAVITVDWSGAE